MMNSFNKNEAAVFSCRLCFLRAFPFISLLYIIYASHIKGSRIPLPNYSYTFVVALYRHKTLHTFTVQTSVTHRCFKKCLYANYEIPLVCIMYF